MHKFMSPKFVGGIFDELDERDEQAPWVGAVHDEPFQEHSGDLLLDCLGVSLGKQV